jgi:succinate dehydrogenase flavin-adding protein (antitoxin of CptAB toxin-antitoxin module)
MKNCKLLKRGKKKKFQKMLQKIDNHLFELINLEFEINISGIS